MSLQVHPQNQVARAVLKAPLQVPVNRHPLQARSRVVVVHPQVPAAHLVRVSQPLHQVRLNLNLGARVFLVPLLALHLQALVNLLHLHLAVVHLQAPVHCQALAVVACHLQVQAQKVLQVHHLKVAHRAVRRVALAHLAQAP